ncbi:MAG: hypothetical protein E6G01_06925 [Actinobacteria bacterium]|nr:MAG: hypothetical protein E6G01_06925 [Actinomycetota bacterium]
MADVGRLNGGGRPIEGDVVAGEAAQDALLARLTLLSEASTVLTETLDPDAALYRLAQLVVPVLGDWCGVHVMADWTRHPGWRAPLRWPACSRAGSHS